MKTRLLVVDGNKNDCVMTSEILRREGFEVDLLYDGYEAIQHLESEQSYDLIISGFLMPKADGLELANHIKDNGINIPIIIYTGAGVTISASEILAAVQKTVDGVLEKPARTQDMLAMINGLVSQKNTINSQE